MTFVAINWLNISINLILVVFVVVCCLMTLIILMQRPKQEGLGAAFGGGVTDQVFGARTTNVLQRGTVYLGSLFFILSLTLAVLIGQKNKTISIDKGISAAKEEKAKSLQPAVEVTPGALRNELPPAPPAPAETPKPGDAPADAPKDPAPQPAPAETPSTQTPPAVTPPPADASGTPENKPKEP